MVLPARFVSKALCIRHLSSPAPTTAPRLQAPSTHLDKERARTCDLPLHTSKIIIHNSVIRARSDPRTKAVGRNHNRNAMQERRRSTAMDVTVTTTLCYLATAALLLLASPCSAAQVVVTIEEACRMAASDSDDNVGAGGVSYDHCVSSLASDARSRDAADLHHLAALATRIAVEHAAATEARIEDLGEVEENPHARARLHHCLDLYNAAADVLRDALDNLRARVYGKAAQQLAAALGAAESCEDVWKGEERVPVAAHDREYGRMALVALGLTRGIA